MPRDGSLPPPQVHRLSDDRVVVFSEQLADSLGRAHFHIGKAVTKVEEEDPAFFAAHIERREWVNSRGVRQAEGYALDWFGLEAAFCFLRGISRLGVDMKASKARYYDAFVAAGVEMPPFVPGRQRLWKKPVITEVAVDPPPEPEDGLPEPKPDDVEPVDDEETEEVRAQRAADVQQKIDTWLPPRPAPDRVVKEPAPVLQAAMVPFLYDHGGRRYTVRGALIDGAPWVIGKDAAGVLGYADPNDAVRRHCKGAVKRRLPGECSEVVMIPEPDIYRLIMRSNMPAAEAFQDFVCGTVLPAIRKTGRYETQPQAAVGDLRDPDTLIPLLAHYAGANKQLSADLSTSRKETEAERKARLAAEARAAENQQAADILQALATSGVEWGLVECADQFGIAPLKEFIPTLHRLGYLKYVNGKSRARRAWVVKGVLRNATDLIVHPQTGNLVEVVTAVKITGLGIGHFARLFGVGVKPTWGQGVFDFNPKDPKKPH